MNKSQVADILDRIGTLLELRGENPFKCRAYHNASRIVSGLTKDLQDLIESNELKNIKGIGEALTEKITELVQTGSLKYYDDLKSSLPDGLLEMLRIQGLGPKRVKVLHEKMKISSIDHLKEAAEKHLLANLEGFGEKSEENILKGIELLRKHAEQHLYAHAIKAAEPIYQAIKEHGGVIRCEVAGSLRRRKEVIGDIDVLASAKSPATRAIMQAFTKHSDVEAVVAAGETKSSVRLKSGINCDLRIVSDEQFPFALAYFTGSKEHNIEMRSRAKHFGWSLNEYGFSSLGTEQKRGRAKQIVKCKNEEDIFAALELSYIPPELREQMGEIEAAQSGQLPHLVDYQDVRGTLHCHTTYSDGLNTLEEMALAARNLGWEYLGIADHSKIAAYAGGLSESKVKQQLREIDTLNSNMTDVHLLKGTEVDILPDGSLDWSDSVLKQFDYVVASIHSKFKMTEKESTKRIIKAIKNKYVTMLGHPTGRLLLERDGYPVNMIEVIDAAADTGTFIEINAHPLRLDLDWRLCKYAKEKGVAVSINPDAHHVDGLNDVRYGVAVARKGWLEKSDVINTKETSEIVKVLKKKRQ